MVNMQRQEPIRQAPAWQRLQPLQNHHLGSKLKTAKKVPKTTPESDYSCSMQKTAPKNHEYWKNETIFKLEKNGQYAKAIAFAKSPHSVKNKNCKKC